jgi:hypothetical protein
MIADPTENLAGQPLASIPTWLGQHGDGPARGRVKVVDLEMQEGSLIAERTRIGNHFTGTHVDGNAAYGTAVVQ